MSQVPDTITIRYVTPTHGALLKLELLVHEARFVKRLPRRAKELLFQAEAVLDQIIPQDQKNLKTRKVKIQR